MFEKLKKFLVPISVTVVFALLVVIYFVFLRSANMYEAIPDSAVAVIEINDWSKFSNELNSKQSAIDLKKTTAMKKLMDEVAFMGRFFSYDAQTKSQVFNGKLTVSAHLTSADDFDYLFTIPAKGLNSKEIDLALRNNKDIASVNARMFKERSVEDVVMKDGTKFCFTYIKGVLVFSFTSFLTETSVTAITSGNNLNNDKDLCKVIKRNRAEEGVNVFINFRKADVFFPVALKSERTGLLSDLRSFQSWAGYSISFGEEQISFNGKGLLTGGKKGDDVPKNILANTIWNSVPDNAAYVNIGFNVFSTDNEAHPDENKMAKDAFKDWAGEAHAFVTLEPLKEDFSDQNIFLIQVKDEGKAIAGLKKLMAVDGSKTLAVDSFMNTAVFNLKGGSVINQSFGSSFTGFGNSYFSISNHLAVFCNNEDILKFVLEKLSRGETLNKDETCRKAIEACGKTATGVLYINPAKASLLLSGMIKDGSSLQAFLAQQGAIAFLLNAEGEWNTSHGVFMGGGGSKARAGLLWKTKLQTLSTFVPQIVINESTGDKEIFTQDTAYNIYLLSKSGEVLFTKNISERIIGSVSQLDYYNNGQLLYVFNTSDHVFMLDRFGNDAASYPLRLSNAAIGGLMLLNSNAAKPRYFVPCSNGAIYGYEANGRPLSGWSPRNGLGLITKPLQIVKGKKNDNVLAFNNAGKLMLLGLKGEMKWAVDNLPVTSQNFRVVENGGDFLMMNAAGVQLIEISSDGNDNIKPIIDSAFSFAATATSDTTYQYYFSGIHDVRCYNGKGEFKSAASIKTDIVSGIEVAEKGGMQYVLVKDESAKKVLLYDLELKPVAEYPVVNTGLFTITDLFARKELIGIQPDANGNIACYRIK